MFRTKITIKNLCGEFCVSPLTALKIKRLCNGKLNPITFAAGYNRLRECYNRPTDSDLTLTVISVLLDGYGVEALIHPDDYTGADCIEYVNRGDTYAATICYETKHNAYYLCCWGDFAEEAGADERFGFDD